VLCVLWVCICVSACGCVSVCVGWSLCGVVRWVCGSSFHVISFVSVSVRVCVGWCGVSVDACMNVCVCGWYVCVCVRVERVIVVGFCEIACVCVCVC